MKKFLFPFIISMMIASFAFKNDPGKMPDNDGYPRQEVSSDSAKKMMNQFVKRARKEDHSFTKFNRMELIGILQGMTEDTVKFVMGAYLDDVKGNKKGKPVIMMQIKTGTSKPGGSMYINYSYLEGALCPPPDAPPCSALLEN
jgi:hypothetical protein